MIVTKNLRVAERMITVMCFAAIVLSGILMPSGIALIAMGVGNLLNMTHFNLLFDSALLAILAGIVALIAGPLYALHVASKYLSDRDS